MRLRSPKAPFRLALELAAGAAALLLLVPVAGAAQSAPATATTQTVFRWLNFAFVFGLGGWWVWRRLKNVFKSRAERIAAFIAEAEATRQQAQARLQAAEEKLAAIERETTEMRDRARLDSAAEAVRIRARAREEAERIERAAEAEIASAELAAANRLCEMAIDKTIEYARARVMGRLTPELDARLVGRFVDALGRAGGAL